MSKEYNEKTIKACQYIERNNTTNSRTITAYVGASVCALMLSILPTVQAARGYVTLSRADARYIARKIILQKTA